MSRRMDREGVTDGDVGRILNRRYWDEQKRRGLSDKWWVPFDIGQGFAELNRAAWHRVYRLWVLRDLISPYERKENFRYAGLSLAASRGCDRPTLPK